MLNLPSRAAALVAALLATAPVATAAQEATEPSWDRSWALMVFAHGRGGSSPGQLMNREACAKAAKAHKEILSFGGRTLSMVTCTNIITGEVVEH